MFVIYILYAYYYRFHRIDYGLPLVPEFRRVDTASAPEPLDVGVISGNIGQPEGTHFEFNGDHQPLFSQFAGPLHPLSFPFLANPFLNNFGLGNFGIGSAKAPWWKL